MKTIEERAKERCDKELYVIEYFGLPEDVSFNKTPKVVYADLVDLLAGYEQRIAGANENQPAEAEGESERLRKLLIGQSYSIWKGCGSDLNFEEWQDLFIANNGLISSKVSTEAEGWTSVEDARSYLTQIANMCLANIFHKSINDLSELRNACETIDKIKKIADEALSNLPSPPVNDNR